MLFFQYDFICRAMIAGIVTAVLCPVIGSFVVVRRQSLIGDGLGHIAFAGVAGGYLLGVYSPLCALVFTVAAAIGIELIRRKNLQYSDMGLAIFFYAGMALAIIFSTMIHIPSSSILSFLFGSILTVTAKDLVVMCFGSLLVLLIIYALFDRLMLTSFDQELARVAGINPCLISMIFSILTAVVIVISMSIVGVLLVSAMMVVPVAAAHQLRLGFKATMAWSIVFSLLAVITGLTLSFYFDIAPGGTIVITAVCIYLLNCAGQAFK